MRPKQREVDQTLELYGVMASKLKIEDCKELFKQRKKPRQLEKAEMRALDQWVRYNQNKMPELRLLYHIPNERASDVERADLSGQLVRSGVPDLCLPVARGVWHGLYIELKAGKNTASDNQKWWIEKLLEQKYYAVVVTGWKKASDIIMNYLKRS